MATDSEKEMYLRQAIDAARKAVEYLDQKATGIAKTELLNAAAAIEKLHKLAA